MYTAWFKRLLDILLASFLLVSLSVIWVPVIILYWITFQRPVFFLQERIGKNNRPFKLVKFRTLLPGDGAPQNRRFLLGDVLRFFSIDEIPQLYNVLKGEMSMVGPRPLPVEYLSLYSQQQRLRHTVLPGITGLAQVNGRHSISWEQKFSYDLYYIRNISLALDCRIILKTIVLILSFQKDVSLNEEKFKGTNGR